MQEYQYVCRTATCGTTWQYEVTCPSQAMALEYGKKIALDFVGCPWFMGLDIWVKESQSHIGFVTIDKPTATIKAP